MADGEKAVQDHGDGNTEADKGAQAESKIEPPLPQRERPVWGIGYVKRKIKQRKAEREKETPDQKALRVTASATKWMALFTCFLAILSLLTWWEIRTGGADTHELAVQAKNQATKTKDIADAAEKMRLASERLATSSEANVRAVELSNRQSKRSLDASIEASRTDQRAWLGLKHVRVQEVLEAGKATTIAINFINSGKTPAIDVVLSDVTFQQNENPPSKVTPDDTRTVVSPGNDTESYIDTSVITTEMMEGFKAKTLRCYLRGKMSYRDIFGAPHKTMFCVYLPPSKTLHLFNCKTGNSMD